MKAFHVTLDADPFTVTISRDTHQRLVALPFAREAVSHAVANQDGTVTATR